MIPRTTQHMVIVGAGIIGLATAWTLLNRFPGIRVTVLEKESDVAQHQSGNNSGVVHAGIYYQPGSLKARLCARGRIQIRDFCADHALPYRECGKLLIATNNHEERALLALFERGKANQVPGLYVLPTEGIKEIEPHASGRLALLSPLTAITDFRAVCGRVRELIQNQGGEVVTNAKVIGFQMNPTSVVADTLSNSYTADHAIVCAGLHADLLGQLAGDGPDPQIIPFRGTYMKLRPHRTNLVRGLIYPVPNPQYPFLGIHLTRTVDDNVLIGPNAILATAREGYSGRHFDRSDLARTVRWPGSRRLARKHWRAGVLELYRAASHRAFIRSARRFVPELKVEDVTIGPSGVRAQAVAMDGALLDDFWITKRPRVTIIRNAPSPGATSSFAIAEHIVEQIPMK